MNQQRTDRDIEQALTQWAAEVAPKASPTRLLEETFVRTMGTKQERVYPWNRLLPGRRALSFSRSGAGVGVVALGLLLVLALAIGLAGGGLGPKATPSPSPSPSPTQTATATPVQVPTPSLPAAISVTAEGSVDLTGPVAMVTDGQFLWVLASDGQIHRIDPATGSVVDSVTTGPATDLYNGLAWSSTGLWATDADSAAVFRVDAAPLKLAASIPAGQSPKGVLANADGVWVADVHGGSVLRIDPLTNLVADTIIVGRAGASGPNWLGDGLGSIWTTVPNATKIVRVDPVAKVVQANIDAPAGFTACGGMVISDNAAWVTSCGAGTRMARADATTNTIVALIQMPGNGYNPVLINGSIWVSVDGGDQTSRPEGTIVRIDPATNSIDRVLVPTTQFGGGGDICVAAGSVWVTDGYHHHVLRLPLAAFTS
jgi:streptogramin lyase